MSCSVSRVLQCVAVGCSALQCVARPAHSRGKTSCAVHSSLGVQ